MAKFNAAYRNGGEGMTQWVEDFVRMPIYPEGSPIPVWVPMNDLPQEPNLDTGRSYQTIWDAQKDILHEALAMKNGRFIHRLIVLCWMRGEGKTVIGPCLINLWKFMNWPRQNIVLGANSKDQTKFITFDIIRDMILNSPNLLALVGKKNIREKEIRLRDAKGNVVSTIRAVSSFSGILSNITGYAFSEIFQMNNPEFFQQIDGSIRNVPNAMGVIDSTVSSKDHILYQLYEADRDGQDPTIYFSYRCSHDGDYRDYWHPNQNQSQLDSYRVKFKAGNGFKRYFQNLWSAGSEKFFPEEIIEASYYVGLYGRPNDFNGIKEQISRIHGLRREIDAFAKKDVELADFKIRFEVARKELQPVEDIYQLGTTQGLPRHCSIDELEDLSDFFDTDWAIAAGIDRADPGKTRTGARTMLSVVGKGMIGSRSNPHLWTSIAKDYIYCVLHVADIADHSLVGIKAEILKCHEEYEGVDLVSSERFGLWDLKEWGEENDIRFDLIYPTFDRQKDAFYEFFRIMDSGRLKMPRVYVPGSRSSDILREELSMFESEIRSETQGWFGSPEKKKMKGVQDDLVFAMAWAVYGARVLTVDDFRGRGAKVEFGDSISPRGLLGAYA